MISVEVTRAEYCHGVENGATAAAPGNENTVWVPSHVPGDLAGGTQTGWYRLIAWNG